MARGVYSAVLGFLLFVTSLSAEADPVYQLYTPTADEYLAALPRLLDQAHFDYLSDDAMMDHSDFLSLTMSQLTHYGPLRERSYEQLAPLHPYYASSYFIGGISQDVFAAWLRETSVDFATYDSAQPLTFDDFVIKVIPRDFNADGQPEWVLDITHENRFKWWEVLVLTEDGDYQSVDRLGFFDSSASYWLPDSGFQEEIAFEDLNQDRLPEWVIGVGGYGGGHKNYGNLYILQWDEDRGELTSPQDKDTHITYSSPAGGGRSLFPYGVTVSLRDTNNNGTIEIQVDQVEHDNWGCSWTQTRVYGWTDHQYTLLSNVRLNDEVKGCAWRAAEEAMWDHDYQTAITHYERAFTLPFGQSFVWSNTYNDLWEYAQIRLALAYALTDQSTQARESLHRLQDVDIHSGAVRHMDSMLRAMLGHETPESLCQAFYDLWFNYLDLVDENSNQDWGMIPLHAYIGSTEESLGMWSWFPLPHPEKAGCDITEFGKPLSDHAFPQESYQAYYSSDGPELSFHPTHRVSSSHVVWSIRDDDQARFLIDSRFLLMQIQSVGGDEWQARYLFATALRQNNRLDEALEQYIYIYEHSPIVSVRELAGLYLKPVSDVKK